MVGAARQLSLPFCHRPALSAEAFVVADGNAEALAWFDRWPAWPGPAIVLYGPPGCGKTHLVQIFLNHTGGREIRLSEEAMTDPEAMLGPGPVVAIDDADRWIEGGLAVLLLHLYNLGRERGIHLLLTGRSAPTRWPIGLEDLRSRLASCPAVPIRGPDDALMAAVVRKLLSDRQLAVEDDVVKFLLTRMERSYAAARRWVALIDQASLAAGRPATVPFIRQLFEAEVARGHGNED